MIILLLLSSFSMGQDLNSGIYQAFISGDMDLWYGTMVKMETKWKKTGNINDLYDLTLAQYGYIAFSMAVKEKKRAASYVVMAERNTIQMINHDVNWARAHALMGAIYGFKVGQEPFKAPVYGRRSFDENEIAMKLDPGDPQVWMERGNIEHYKPSIFGGNKKDAIIYYKKAITLYEKEPETSERNWLYLNTLSGLASVYVKTGQANEANTTYLKILRIEPSFQWVRDEVYPAFKEKYGF